MIGDPSGKGRSATLLSTEQIVRNVAGIRPQLERFLDFDAARTPRGSSTTPTGCAPLDLLDFLRDTGKHFTVNYMLQKESVQPRLESDDGISFTEFSYMLLQAHDFLELHRAMADAADGRQRSVGQHHCRHRADPPSRRGGARPGLPADDDAPARSSARPKPGRSGWIPRARRRTLLPVLAEHRRSRRRPSHLKFFTWLVAPTIEALEEQRGEAPESARRSGRSRARSPASCMARRRWPARSTRHGGALWRPRSATPSADDVLTVFEDVPSIQKSPRRPDPRSTPRPPWRSTPGVIEGPCLRA